MQSVERWKLRESNKKNESLATAITKTREILNHSTLLTSSSRISTSYAFIYPPLQCKLCSLFQRNQNKINKKRFFSSWGYQPVSFTNLGLGLEYGILLPIIYSILHLSLSIPSLWISDATPNYVLFCELLVVTFNALLQLTNFIIPFPLWIVK